MLIEQIIYYYPEWATMRRGEHNISLVQKICVHPVHSRYSACFPVSATLNGLEASRLALISDTPT